MLFFHFLNLTILNSFIILASCGSNLSHRQFRLMLVRDPIQEAGRVPRPQNARQRRRTPSMIQLKRLDSRHSRHWLMQCKRIQCHVCSARNKETRTKYRCQECNKVVCYTIFFRYITPNCITGNQLTLKWKSGTHNCKKIITIVITEALLFSSGRVYLF